MLFNTTESMAESTMSGKNNNSLVVPIMEAAGGGSGGGGDGSSIEIAKRPRGRPPGSKNKPKPPVIITRESDPSSALRPHILEIPSGADVIDSIARFSRRKSIGICVLAGSGAVSNVVLRQPPHPTTEVPSVTAAATVGFHGRLEILSLSATVMPPAAAGVVATPGVTVSLAGPQGQVIGGAVVGPLVAAGMVTVVAAAFENPTFHRLPVVEAEDHHDVAESSDGGGSGSGKMKREKVEADERQHYEHNRREYAHHHHHHHRQQEQQEVQMVDQSCGGGMAMYSSHFPAEVIWAPGVRPPHPPHY